MNTQKSKQITITLIAATVATLGLAATERLCAAPFQNLDFEQATIVSATPGFVPSNAQNPLNSAAALPGWTATLDNTVCNAVWGDNNSLDLTSVTLIQHGSLLVPPMQGNYEVQLYAVANNNPPLFNTASISQMGDLPSNTKSIEFLTSNPGLDIPSVPYVFLNGTSIPLVMLSTSDGITTWAGDVDSFAGTTAQLTFEAMGQTANPEASDEDIFELDAIIFSSSPVPEPASCLLLLAALPLLLKRSRRM